jgi:hypothetical protein
MVSDASKKQEPIGQTPDELIEELEVLGEERARAKLDAGEFPPVAEPLVRGWLERKEQARQHAEELRTEAEARAKVERQVETLESAQEAQRLAGRAQMMALAALIVAGFSVLLSVLVLLTAGK